MRKPSEYIAAAVRNVQNRYMADSAFVMTHGQNSATVTRTASFRSGEPPVTGDAPTEVYRVIAIAADFPTLDRDDLVLCSRASSREQTSDDPQSSSRAFSREQTSHIVTSLRKDPVSASATVGLSEALSKISADYLGTRGSRHIHFPLDILAENNGKSTDLTDAYAPTEVYSWTIVIAAESWPDAHLPSVGDELRFEKDGDHRLRVARVVNKQKHFVLNARSR